MANEGGEGEEEKLLEEELEHHLREQRDCLSSIKLALSSDPNNHDLLSVEEELVSSIKDAEEGLLNLKRTRLLREADAMHVFTSCSGDVQADHVGQLIEPNDPCIQSDVAVDTLVSLEEPRFQIGSKCRFRHTDGRWYNGQIVELDGSCAASVAFLNPTSEHMMICKFFLQQRCRFGANCRLSHGSHVPLSALKNYVTPHWGQSYVGECILAVSESGARVWREAELRSWDDKLNQGVVVFQDNGSTETVGNEAIALPQYADLGDDDEGSDYSSASLSGSSDLEEDGGPQGLGFVETTALQKGIQTDTAIFAKWENHTRGIASKMMANMGYREGMGLGSSGQGMVDPIPVKVLPPKQSLDHAFQSCSQKDEHGGSQEKKLKKRSRGGKRKRDRKFAEAARAAKQEEEPRPDIFSLINSHLLNHGQIVNGDSVKKQKSKETKKEDRRSLVVYEEEAKELRARVEKLEEMVNRNRKEKAVYEGAMRKLAEARKALADAEAKHTSASHAVVSKEKEKKWLRF